MTALDRAHARSAEEPRTAVPVAWLDTAAVVAALVLLAWGAWNLISIDAPLGHDEAWYAVMGEAVARRLGDVGLASHRPAFFGWLSAPVQLVTQSEEALRLIALPFGLGSVFAAGWLARRVGRVAGLVALAGMVTAPTLYRGASLFLTDLPAAALLLAAAALLWYGFEERAAPGWTVAAAAVCMAVAFHMRFGSVLPVALLTVTATLVWHRRFVAHARAVVAGVLAGAVVLLPHVVTATVELGAPWRRVLQTSEAVVGGQERGLPTYVDMFPVQWPGLLPGGLLLVAVAALAAALLGRRGGLDARLRRLVVLLAAPGLLHFLLIGWTAHPEERFLYPALAFGVTAGAAVVGQVSTRLAALREERGWRTALALALAAGLALGAADGVRGYGNEVAERERMGELNLPIKHGAVEVARREDPPRCKVLTSYNPQFQWYSGCPAVKLPADPDRVREHTAESDVLLVLFTDGKHQPGVFELDAYLEQAGAEQRGMVIDTGTLSSLEPVTIYRVPQQGTAAP